MTAGTNENGPKMPNMAFLQTLINIIAGLLSHKRKKKPLPW